MSRKYDKETLTRAMALSKFSTDDLKAELTRRKSVERARRHMESAEATLKRAQHRVAEYQRILQEEDFENKSPNKNQKPKEGLRNEQKFKAAN